MKDIIKFFGGGSVSSNSYFRSISAARFSHINNNGNHIQILVVFVHFANATGYLTRILNYLIDIQNNFRLNMFHHLNLSPPSEILIRGQKKGQ